MWARLRSGGRDVRTVEVDGLRLRVAIRGSGRPLLLLMGIGGNLEMWGPFDDALRARSVPSLCVDAPGTGGSSSYSSPRRLPGLARSVDGQGLAAPALDDHGPAEERPDGGGLGIQATTEQGVPN